LLTRIEAKTVDSNGKTVGLNLTRASLDAATKYPWSNLVNPLKFGLYGDDIEIFNWMREGAPEGRKCIEAQIMDWSDDCAYSVHDLEDAIFAGQVSVAKFENDFDLLYKEMVDGYKSDATKDEAIAALGRLQALSCWPVNFDRTHRSLARLKDTTSQLIGRFVLAAENQTRLVHGDGPLTRYSANLEIPREAVIEVDFLKAVAGHYLINAAASQDRYEKQNIVIHELVEMLFEAAPLELDPIFEDDWKLATNDSERLRVVVDQIASLTDPGAYALHAHLRSKRS
jgi:dGTPase